MEAGFSVFAKVVDAANLQQQHCLTSLITSDLSKTPRSPTATAWGNAIADDSRFSGPVTVNRQSESGKPLLSSKEQLPPSLCFFICSSRDLVGSCLNYFFRFSLKCLVLPVLHSALHRQISAKGRLHAHPVFRKYHSIFILFF